MIPCSVRPDQPEEGGQEAGLRELGPDRAQGRFH